MVLKFHPYWLDFKKSRGKGPFHTNHYRGRGPFPLKTEPFSRGMVQNLPSLKSWKKLKLIMILKYSWKQPVTIKIVPYVYFWSTMVFENEASWGKTTKTHIIKRFLSLSLSLLRLNDLRLSYFPHKDLRECFPLAMTMGIVNHALEKPISHKKIVLKYPQKRTNHH